MQGNWMLAAALAALLGAATAGRTAQAGWLDGKMPEKVKPAIALEAQPFPLEDVRLLDGPFKHAQDLAAAYLLEFETDRLLANFRKDAGLEPKTEHYGGWESKGVSGHTLGHYLSACALAHASTGDEKFRQRVAYIVDELQACQEKNGDGYVAAIPDGRRVFAEVFKGEIRSKGFDLNGLWAPWYTQHKLFAGLFDAYRYCGNAKALAIAIKLGDWAIAITANLDDARWQKMLDCEHGGMNDVLAELYAITGEQKYLALARKFHHRAILDPLAKKVDCLPGKHANTQIPKIAGVARRHELTGDAADRAIAEFFWDRVVNHHSYVTGGHCIGEYFGPPDVLSERLGEHTSESCNVYNMLKLTRHLFCWKPRAAVADFYERALYNHILATQHPGDGRVIYNLSLEMGGYKHYLPKTTHFTCCDGSGLENHVKYGDSIYFRGADALYVNLFIASKLSWPSKGLTLTQKTKFPDEALTRFSFECKKSMQLALRVRRPYWTEKSAEILVNGQPQKAKLLPSGYYEIDRKWKSGDRVEIPLPMALRLETMPDNPRRAGVMYGPLVLAGELGEVKDPAAKQSNYVPVFVTDDRPPEAWLTPVKNRPLNFRTGKVGQPRDVTLLPFFRMHDKRYTVYWDFFTQPQWAEKQKEYEAALEREKKRVALTTDFVQPGEMQPERDHAMKGEKTGKGEHQGRKWRDATDGGWFSFEMKIDDAQPLDLRCTYWGGETGQREFDILIDGEKIATQKLSKNKPNEFFDATYAIPEKLTRGKKKVVVRFQAHPNNRAGGLFGLRLLRREAAPVK